MTSILKVSDIQGPSSTAVAMSTKPSFFATNNANAWQSFGNTSFNTMPFNTTEHDIGNNYDTSNYKFTAPITGSYYFYMQFLHDATTTSSYGECRFRKTSGGSTTTIAFKHNSFQGDTVALATVTYLQANDYIEAQGKVGNTNADDWYDINYYAYFCGYLIG
jgi:hypothetical protein